MTRKEEDNRKYALAGTIMFHALLLILFLFTGMTYLEPPPPEQGILINFGTDDQGSGQVQTSSTESSQSEDQAEEQTENLSRVDPVEEEMLTQEVEQTVNVQKKEEERIREEEPVVEEEPKPSKALSDAMKAWDKSKNPSKSDGNTGQQGDQGDIRGDKNSRNYDGGLGGSGYTFSLAGRRMLTKPDINDQSQEEGKVVVDIIVDKYGKVIRATPGARGSTTTSSVLYRIAKDAAMTTKFDANPSAPAQQKGQIVFTFLLKG